MIGTTLQGYRIVDKIKEGSVGTVWRAVDRRNQVVALKQISSKNAAVSGKLRKFEREALLTKSLSHAGVIKVHDYVEAKPQPFFVMEYFESENLKYATWNLPERVHKKEFSILRQIAEALAYIHSQGIVHKDLKPENVLIAPDSRIRLIDFSLSTTKWDRLLQFGRRVEGTPLYMAPEQIRGEKGDARTDIYSFGVLAYELLAKRTPFLGNTEVKVMEKHVKESVPPLQTYVKTISSQLEDVILRMLAKRPADRYPDMTAVLFELSRWERKDTLMRMRQVAPVRPKQAPSPLEVPSTV